MQMQRGGRKEDWNQRRECCLPWGTVWGSAYVDLEAQWLSRAPGDVIVVGQKVKEFFFCLTVSLHILHSGWTWREAQDLNALEPVLHSRISDSVVGKQDQFLENCNSERKGSGFMNFILICCLNILHE